MDSLQSYIDTVSDFADHATDSEMEKRYLRWLDQIREMGVSANSGRSIISQAEQQVRVYEKLMRENPERYSLKLVESMDLLSWICAAQREFEYEPIRNVEWDIKRYKELGAIMFSLLPLYVEAYEVLAKNQFAKYGPALAIRLDQVLSASSDTTIKISLVTRLISIYERLATASLAKFGTSLAVQFNRMWNLYHQASEIELRNEFIAREIDAREKLAKCNFKMFGGDLAICLFKLIPVLDVDGDKGAELAIVKRVVEVREVLTSFDLMAYGDMLLSNLYYLSRCYLAVGDKKGAQDAFKRIEALKVRMAQKAVQLQQASA